jgi:hypothetical protein
VVSITPLPLYPGDTAADTHRIGESIGPSAGQYLMKKKKSLHPIGNRTPIPRISSLYPSRILWGIYGRFQYRYCIGSDDGMSNERLIGKDSEGNGYGLIEILSRNLSGVIEENHEKAQWG